MKNTKSKNKKGYRVKKDTARLDIFLSYVAFSVVNFAILWVVQTVMLSTFFQNMQEKEVKQVAAKIYNSNNYNFTLCEEVQKSHLMAMLIDENMQVIFVADEHSAPFAMSDPDAVVQKEREKIFTGIYSQFAVQMVREGLTEFLEKREKDFIYGCVLKDGKTILLINAPLGAMETTVSVLRYQLIMVVGISFFLAIALSIILANKLSDEKLHDARLELLANITHDLRTPLTLIRGYAESLRDFPGDEESRKKDTEIIIKESERLSGLVNDILEYASLSEKQKIKKNRFDLSVMAGEVVNQFGLNFINLDIEENCFVDGCKPQLERVLYNLIDNAIRHSEDGKKVDVNVFHRNKKIRMEVCNYGKPIPAENLKLIWDRYFTFRQQRMNDEKSGLGLAIVKGILSNHGAVFGVSSDEEEGTVFWAEF